MYACIRQLRTQYACSAKNQSQFDSIRTMNQEFPLTSCLDSYPHIHVHEMQPHNLDSPAHLARASNECSLPAVNPVCRFIQ
jgi:hypothetical protein